MMTKSKATGTRGISRRFLDKLGSMHTAEEEEALALPLMEVAAKSKDLKDLLKIHLKDTKGHARTLEKIARELGVDLPRKRCPPITKLIGQGVKVIGKRLVTSDQDKALIGVGRRIEDFEIRAYDELCDLAQDEGLTHQLALLTSILHQEEMALELLGDLAVGKGPLKELVQHASVERASGSRATAEAGRF
jgi:ferritin-like metal-binding protein YciE